MAIGPGELCQHEAVKPIALAARDGVTRTSGPHLVRMNSNDYETGIEEPLNQQAVRALDRDQANL
jgi:hypothetical protein